MKKMKDTGKWKAKKCAEKRGRKDALGLGRKGREVEEREMRARGEGGEEGGGKDREKGVGWWLVGL